jgi:hypothetical protein
VKNKPMACLPETRKLLLKRKNKPEIGRENSGRKIAKIKNF